MAKHQQSPPTDDQLRESIPKLLYTMKRILTLHVWEEMVHCGDVELHDESENSLFKLACYDASMLAIRAIDDFFCLRLDEQPAGSDFRKSTKASDLIAEHFGAYKAPSPILSKDRRAAMNQAVFHFTFGKAQDISTDPEDDLQGVLPPCIEFLDHLLTLPLLHGHDYLASQVKQAKLGMESVVANPHWGKIGTFVLPEVLATTTLALLRQFNHPMAPVFERQMARKADEGVLVRGRETLRKIRLPMRQPNAKRLLTALDEIQRNAATLGDDEQEHIRIVHDSWKELASLAPTVRR